MKTISDYLHSITRARYTPEEKEALLAYMSKREYLEWASTKRITDRVTGETVESVCFLGYSDGEFNWTSSEAYLLRKYDLALSKEFVRHVAEKMGEASRK